MRSYLIILLFFFSIKASFSQQFVFGCYFNMPCIAAVNVVSTDLNYLSDAEGVNHLAKIEKKRQFLYSIVNANIAFKAQFNYRKWSFVFIPSIVRARSVGFFLNTKTYSGEDAEYKASYLCVGTGAQIQARYTFFNRPGYRFKLAGGLNYNYWLLQSEWEAFRLKALFDTQPYSTLSEADEPMYNLLYENSPHFLSYKFGLGIGLNKGGGLYHQLYLFYETQFGKIGNGDFKVGQILLEWDLLIPLRSNFKKRMIYFDEN